MYYNKCENSKTDTCLLMRIIVYHNLSLASAFTCMLFYSQGSGNKAQHHYSKLWDRKLLKLWFRLKHFITSSLHLEVKLKLWASKSRCNKISYFTPNYERSKLIQKLVCLGTLQFPTKRKKNVTKWNHIFFCKTAVNKLHFSASMRQEPFFWLKCYILEKHLIGLMHWTFFLWCDDTSFVSGQLRVIWPFDCWFL